MMNKRSKTAPKDSWFQPRHKTFIESQVLSLNNLKNFTENRGKVNELLLRVHKKGRKKERS